MVKVFVGLMVSVRVKVFVGETVGVGGYG